MNTSRVNELVASMTSFGRTAYHKKEILPELLALQQDFVAATPWKADSDITGYKLYDVESRLAELNAQCEGVASESVASFIEGAKKICNMIRAEISGNRGEAIAFSSLRDLDCPHYILRNIELEDGTGRTEIDLLVITPKAFFIIEVKNTSKNIFIDHQGNYYRTGDYLNWDSQIAEKTKAREYFLRQALSYAGIETPNIVNIVVFTNSRIQVCNKCKSLTTCFPNMMSFLIEGYQGDDLYSEETMRKARIAVKRSCQAEFYPSELDVQQIKLDYANALVAIEQALAA